MYNGYSKKQQEKTLSTAKLRLAVLSFLFFLTFVTNVISAHAADLTISGTLYEGDRATTITTGKTIKIAIATSTVSVHSTSTDSGAGTWSITIPDGHSISSSTPITVFVDGDTVKAVTVTKASSTADVTNLDLYSNYVTIKNEATGTTTKATDLYHYDSSNDADIQFSASSTLGRLTVTDGQTLYIASSTTFDMDLPTVTGNFETATTATALASSTLAVSGDFTQNGIFQTASPEASAWTSRTSAADNSWTSVTYGNGLFVAVSQSGTGNRVMTSPDGITWTSRTSAADNQWRSVTYGNGLFVAVSSGFGEGTNRVMTSPDGITWTSRTSAADNYWWSVTYGNGLFVAVAGSGTGNRVMTSPDGIIWTSRTNAADNSWFSITYGNGLFVAVSYSGTGNRVMTSPDGITWTSRTSAADNQWRSVTYGNGLFVAVSDNYSGTVDNRVMTSPDGITWTSRTSAADNYWWSVTYGNGLFVAVSNTGTGNRVMTSAELHPLFLMGTTAQVLSGGMTSTSTISSIYTAGAGTKTFTANASTSDLIITSTSGTVTAPTALTITGHFSNSSTFVAPTDFYFAGTGNQTATGSWNGLPNIYSLNSSIKKFNTSATTSNFVIGSGSVVHLPNSVSITGDFVNSGTISSRLGIANDGDFPGYGYINGVTYGNGLFVAVYNTDWGSYSPVMTSPDGITWTARSAAGDDDTWTSITYNNGLFVAVGSTANGASHTVMTSPDGITWTTRSAAANNNWTSVTYGNGLFVAVSQSGTGNRVMTSPDGITWTSRTSAVDSAWTSVTYGNGLFVAVACGSSTFCTTTAANRVMTSPDGITWTARSVLGDNDKWRSVTYGNGLFVAVGDNATDRAMTSPDGITWTTRNAVDNNDEWQSLIYANGLFVAVGESLLSSATDFMMTSPDGITWASVADNRSSAVVAYGNNRFVTLKDGGAKVYMDSHIHLNGSASQTVSGSHTGYSAFASLTVANSIIFTDEITVSDQFTANVSNIEIQLAANATSTFNNVYISGTEGGEVLLRSTASGTRFGIMIEGDYSIAHVNVKDSNGSSTDGAISALGIDSGNNSGWSFALFGITLADGTTLPDTILYPSGSATTTSRFTLITSNSATTTVTSLSLALATPNATSGIERIEITSVDGLTVYGSSTSITGSPVSITLDTNALVVSTTSTEYLVRITPKSHAAMPVSPGVEYAVSTRITEWASDGFQINNSTYGRVVTVDNLSVLNPWTSRTSAANNSWSSVTYGNGLFIAVAGSGTGNRVMTSPDGITWTSRTSAADISWQSVAYGNGLFVVVSSSGTGNRVMTSPDGITWTSRTSAADNTWLSVAYGNGLFVAVACGVNATSCNSTAGDRVMTSPDGITWTSRTASSNNRWSAVTYGNSLFVAVSWSGTGDRVMTSPDGITWTSRTSAADNYWNSVTYGNNLFVAVSDSYLGELNNRVMTSPDGITWTARSAAVDNDWYSVTYGNGLFLAVSDGYLGTIDNRVMTSLDGVIWTEYVGVSDSGWNSVISNDGLFVAVSWNGYVMTWGSVPSVATSTVTATEIEIIYTTPSDTDYQSTVFLYSTSTVLDTPTEGVVYDVLDTIGSSTVGCIDGAGIAATSSSCILTGLTSETQYYIKAFFRDLAGNYSVGWTGVSFISTTTIMSSDVILAVSANQHFYVGQATTTIGTLTVTDDIITPSIASTTNLRLTIATTTTDFRFDTNTTSLTFGGTAAGKVSSTVSYEDSGATLIVDVITNFAAGDTLTIYDVAVGSFAALSTTTSQLSLYTTGSITGTPTAQSLETFRITGALIVTDHTLDQISNEFSFQNKVDEPIFAFNLSPTGENATVTDMVITLSGIKGIDSGNISDFRLYVDNNSDRLLDGGDTQLDAAGILTINGQNGALTFSSDFLATTSADYIITADITTVNRDSSVVFSLPDLGLTGTGVTSLYASYIESTVSRIQHHRYASSGGGNSARIGTPAPEGAGVVIGGEEGGGGGAGEEADGENIVADPNYFRPTTTGTPHNEWTNGSNALSSDGTYATAATTSLRQSYTGFGFGIPSGNTIQGIAVKLDASGTTADGTIDVSISWDNGSSYTTAKATPTFTGSDIVYTVGGVADTWGRSWSVAEFGYGFFILRVAAQPAANTIRLDALEIRVFHQAGGGGSGGGGGI